MGSHMCANSIQLQLQYLARQSRATHKGARGQALSHDNFCMIALARTCVCVLESPAVVLLADLECLECT